LRRHTKVLGALLDHPAIDLPQAIAGVDDLHSVRDDLVAGQDILGGKMLVQVLAARGSCEASLESQNRLGTLILCR
jgi:hypothetical protein